MFNLINSENGPFMHKARSVPMIAFWMMCSLSILAGFYSFFYDPGFILKFLIFCSIALIFEMFYLFLSEGKIRLKSGSSAITAGILVLSVPSTMPFMPLIFALILALFLAKLSVKENAIHFNPALIGRLFLMLAFNNEIVKWSRTGVDSMTAATPLELFHFEEVMYELLKLLTGQINGNWEEIYEIVSGSPGEIFSPVILILAIILCYKKILNLWAGISFILSFAFSCFIIKEPVLFNVFSGSVIFAAVFIAGDPKTMPLSKTGKIIAGIIAGIINAYIRKYTFYSEGIVFSFLFVNLLTPLIDRITFTIRGNYLSKKHSNHT